MAAAAANSRSRRISDAKTSPLKPPSRSSIAKLKPIPGMDQDNTDMLEEAETEEKVELSGCLQLILDSAKILRQEAIEEMEKMKIKDPNANVEPRRRSLRPTSGYLANPFAAGGFNGSRRGSKNPFATSENSEEERKLEEEEGGDTFGEGDEDDDEEDDSLLEDDDLFGPFLPKEDELRYRWQRWSKSYRSRLLLEHAASKGYSGIGLEDRSRSKRMKKVNPKFILRNWITMEVVNELVGLPEIAPRDYELEKLERKLERIKAGKADQIDFHKDGLLAGATLQLPSALSNTTKNSDDEYSDDTSEDETLNERAESSNTSINVESQSPVISIKTKRKKKSEKVLDMKYTSTLDRAIRILIGDIWGDLSDNNRLANDDDIKAAERWGGKGPRVIILFFCQQMIMISL